MPVELGRARGGGWCCGALQQLERGARRPPSCGARAPRPGRPLSRRGAAAPAPVPPRREGKAAGVEGRLRFSRPRQPPLPPLPAPPGLPRGQPGGEGRGAGWGGEG